jgi:hypothetical protein
MRRKAYIIGILALGLTATTVSTSPAFDRFVSSAQCFRHYFRDLKKRGASLSTVERFVFSFVLANTHAQAPRAQNDTGAPERRT